MKSDPCNLLTIYTTTNGRTGDMVQPIQKGVIDSGLKATVKTISEVCWEDMVSANGIIVGTPVRFGDVDWEIKRLFDVTALQGYPGPLSGKVGGAFTGGGKPVGRSPSRLQPRFPARNKRGGLRFSRQGVGGRGKLNRVLLSLGLAQGGEAGLGTVQ